MSLKGRKPITKDEFDKVVDLLKVRGITKALAAKITGRNYMSILKISKAGGSWDNFEKMKKEHREYAEKHYYMNEGTSLEPVQKNTEASVKSLLFKVIEQLANIEKLLEKKKIMF